QAGLPVDDAVPAPEHAASHARGVRDHAVPRRRRHGAGDGGVLYALRLSVTRLDTPSSAAISGYTPSRPAVEDWVAELERGRFDAAWDLFLDRYRRLIFAAIRHYAQDYDDVMDVFARANTS